MELALLKLEPASTTATTTMQPACPPTSGGPKRRLHPDLESGDICFIILCTTFIFLQTPAAGLLQAGLIRRKNSVSMVYQTISGLIVGSLLFYIVGCAMVYGDAGSAGFVGNPFASDNIGFFFSGIHAHKPNPQFGIAKTIPGVIAALFQATFALMTPLIVTGCWAERMSYSACLLFTVLFPFFIYYPIACWAWNNDGWAAKWGALDFSGSGVIHASSGFSALAVALTLQPRKNFEKIVHGHHNIPLAALSCCIVLVAWYSFNSGSAYAANWQAANAVLNTHMSACMGGLVWTLLTRIRTGYWSITGVMNGILSGLGAITGASGYTPSQTSLLAGALGAASGWTFEEFRLKYALFDDVLSVVALQGIPGCVGLTLLGFTARADMVPCEYTNATAHCCDPELLAGCGTNGVFFGGGFTLLGKQLVFVLSIVVWSFAMTWLIMKFMARTVGTEISAEEEELGLDLSQMGIPGYDHDLAGSGSIYETEINVPELVSAQRLCDAASHGNIFKLHRQLWSTRADVVDHNQKTAMHLAAANNHTRVMAELLRFGCPLDARDKEGNPPIMDAVKADALDAIEWLAAHGATMGSHELIKLMMDAAADGNASMIRRLVKAGADPSCHDYDYRSPAHIAATEGHPGVLNVLRSLGANMETKDRWTLTPYEDASRGNHHACMEAIRPGANHQRSSSQLDGTTAGNDATAASSSTAAVALPASRPSMLSSDDGGKETQALLDDKRAGSDGDSANGSSNNKDRNGNNVNNSKSSPRNTSAAARELCTAAVDNNVKEVRRLLKKGASPMEHDYSQVTALHAAASSNAVEVIRIFLAECPDINVNVLDGKLLTPLSAALLNDAQEAAALLRQKGGSVVDKRRGYDLCDAAARGDLEELEALRAVGINMATGDVDSRSALHLAASEGHEEVCAWLLNTVGLDPNPRDRFLNTPLDDATRHGHTAVAQLLRNCGGLTKVEVMAGKISPFVANRLSAAMAAASSGESSTTPRLTPRSQHRKKEPATSSNGSNNNSTPTTTAPSTSIFDVFGFGKKKREGASQEEVLESGSDSSESTPKDASLQAIHPPPPPPSSARLAPAEVFKQRARGNSSRNLLRPEGARAAAPSSFPAASVPPPKMPSQQQQRQQHVEQHQHHQPIHQHHHHYQQQGATSGSQRAPAVAQRSKSPAAVAAPTATATAAATGISVGISVDQQQKTQRGENDDDGSSVPSAKCPSVVAATPAPSQLPNSQQVVAPSAAAAGSIVQEEVSAAAAVTSKKAAATAPAAVTTSEDSVVVQGAVQDIVVPSPAAKKQYK